MPKTSTIFDFLTDTRSAMSAPFMPVDVARQAKSRKLAERGANDGVRNVPGAAAPDLSLAEQEIVTDIVADRERCIRSLTSNLRAYNDGLSSLQTGMDVAGLRHAADEAGLRFKEIRARWSGDIGELRRGAAQATAEFDEFKERHRIKRAPRLPDDSFRSKALLFVFVLLESLANGLFFAPGADYGLLGGLSLAFVLSAMNVGVGAFVGLAILPQKNRSNWFVAALWFAIFCCFEVGVLIFNAFVAHFREIYGTAGDATNVPDVWAHLVATPVDLSSIYSWLLFGMGFIFCNLAVWKGYGFDDPYPGYGAAERRRADATRAYYDERDGLIDEARETAEDYSEKALRAIETLRASSSQRQQAKGARARAIADYSAHENDLAQAAQQLLTIYREANVARRTEPPPAHFAVRFVFPDKALERPALRILLTDQGMEHDADSLIEELDRLQRRVLDEHSLVLAQAPGEV